MSHERLRPHYFFDEAKIAQLKQIAPECFEDGKINFETLRQNLGDWAQDEEDPELEHFGLFWPGKRDARKAAAIPPQGALEPVWGQGLKADCTPDTDGVNDSKNIFIEGENLEVLKLLQKSYAGKVKMIYIDPPYNTGNDFVYDDDFTEPLQEYLRRTGQVDEEGKPMTTNKRSDGRFHSKWLSMMYPRLRLARNLLREDGVIFVSIDDNEVHNLRAVMNEIFGEENFVIEIAWRKTDNQANIGQIARVKEYILTFCKNKEDLVLNKIPLTEKAKKEYSYKDTNGSFRRAILLDKTRGRYFYDVKTKNGKILNGPWMIKEEEFKEKDKNNEILWTSSGDEQPYGKIYLHKSNGQIANDFWDTSFGSNQEASLKLGNIFEGRIFDFPKSTTLLKNIITIGSDKNAIILDFFAGSGSTAHAIIELNGEDLGNRKFISVQLPEEITEGSEPYKAGYKRISDITIERIRRVTKKLKSHNVEGNLGVKFLSLKHSNFKPWKHVDGTSVAHLESQLDAFNTNPLVEEVNKDGLLTEIMLLEGFTLCSTITPLQDIKSNSIRKVSSEYCDHTLLVCLDEKITPETVAALNLNGGDIFICLDSAISNVDKLRLSDKGLIKTI